MEVVLAVTDAQNIVARQLQFVCRWILESVDDLTDEQFRWQPHATAPSIRFHLFHIARCADSMCRIITESPEQTWHREGIAKQWGLEPEQLGFGELGAEVDAEDAMHLLLPANPQFRAYTDRVIWDADTALSHVDDAAFQRVVSGYGGRPMAIGEVITDQLEHLGRHLGMIEAMRGVQGLSGTATI